MHHFGTTKYVKYRLKKEDVQHADSLFLKKDVSDNNTSDFLWKCVCNCFPYYFLSEIYEYGWIHKLPFLLYCDVYIANAYLSFEYDAVFVPV